MKTLEDALRNTPTEHKYTSIAHNMVENITNIQFTAKEITILSRG
jgi:hypothetical protein